MVNGRMYKKIQACKSQGLFRSEIARRLKLDPGTVAKYYDMGEAEYSAYLQSHTYRDKVFDRSTENIIDVYRENGFTKLSMSAVFDYLEEKKGERLPGNEQTLRNYIGYLRESGQLVLKS